MKNLEMLEIGKYKCMDTQMQQHFPSFLIAWSELGEQYTDRLT